VVVQACDVALMVVLPTHCRVYSLSRCTVVQCDCLCWEGCEDAFTSDAASQWFTSGRTAVDALPAVFDAIRSTCSSGYVTDRAREHSLDVEVVMRVCGRLAHLYREVLHQSEDVCEWVHVVTVTSVEASASGTPPPSPAHRSHSPPTSFLSAIKGSLWQMWQSVVRASVASQSRADTSSRVNGAVNSALRDHLVLSSCVVDGTLPGCIPTDILPDVVCGTGGAFVCAHPADVAVKFASAVCHTGRRAMVGAWIRLQVPPAFVVGRFFGPVLQASTCFPDLEGVHWGSLAADGPISYDVVVPVVWDGASVGVLLEHRPGSRAHLSTPVLQSIRCEVGLRETCTPAARLLCQWTHGAVLSGNCDELLSTMNIDAVVDLRVRGIAADLLKHGHLLSDADVSGLCDGFSRRVSSVGCVFQFSQLMAACGFSHLRVACCVQSLRKDAKYPVDSKAFRHWQRQLLLPLYSFPSRLRGCRHQLEERLQFSRCHPEPDVLLAVRLCCDADAVTTHSSVVLPTNGCHGCNHSRRNV
jgi:hypothetical protein